MSTGAGPLRSVRDISAIAYGFMASKVLFTALDLDLFTRLADGPKTLDALAAGTGLAPARLQIFLGSCLSLGLLVREDDAYANAPASQAYLVRTAPSYFGDYYRFQIDRQIYPAFARLREALHGERAEFYRLMDDPEEHGASAAVSTRARLARPRSWQRRSTSRAVGACSTSAAAAAHSASRCAGAIPI